MQGVAYLNAPGEGEATCAALCASGVADMVWTNDVIDTLLFGATAVCTYKQVQMSRAMLNYQKPHESRLRIFRLERVRTQLFDMHVRSSLTWLTLHSYLVSMSRICRVLQHVQLLARRCAQCSGRQIGWRSGAAELVRHVTLFVPVMMHLHEV